MATINSLITDFLEYMEIERGSAVASVENYDRYLRRFAGFARANQVDVPEKINHELLRQYHLWLHRLPDATGKEPIAKVTANYHLIALRAFLKYLIKQGHKVLAPDQIELAKVAERSIDLISIEELNRIISGPEDRKSVV